MTAGRDALPDGHINQMGNGMKGLILAAGAMLSLAGCTTQRELLVTQASRSDGVVVISYQGNEFQRGDADYEEAEALAAKSCAAWGYNGAEAFGSEKTTCLSRRGFGNCGARRVDIPFQCTGGPR